MIQHIPTPRAFALAVSFLAASLSAAQFETRTSRPLATASIAVDLPAEADAFPVSVSTKENRIRIDLPQGAVVPMDLQTASGGFVRVGRTENLENGRMRLELQLAQGLLDRIEYSPQRITLYFESWIGLQDLAEDEDDYRIGPQDKIAITVHNDPKLNSKLEVTKGGTIVAPLVGEVTAAGLTPRGLSLRLAELWGQSYLVDPKVEVQVEEYLSQWAMLSGEVRTPGRVPLKGRTSLKESLTEAGGFGPLAGEVIVISRRADDQEARTQAEIETVPRREFEEGLVNPILRHGDIVTVNRIKYCFVDGEVRRPGRVTYQRGLTLLRAISQAAGVTDWADLSDVRVRAEGETGPGTVYNIKKIRRGKVSDPMLTGGEIIVVGRRVL